MVRPARFERATAWFVARSQGSLTLINQSITELTPATPTPKNNDLARRPSTILAQSILHRLAPIRVRYRPLFSSSISGGHYRICALDDQTVEDLFPGRIWSHQAAHKALPHFRSAFPKRVVYLFPIARLARHG